MNVVALNIDANEHEHLRPPAQVMRMARLSASHPTRLSFMRGLVRRMHAEQWNTRLDRFELDADGVGCAVYVVESPTSDVSLVCFSHNTKPRAGGATRPTPMRQDEFRGKWDATFLLFDGVPDEDDLVRLRRNVPLQEAGRYCPNDIVLTRGLFSAERIGAVVSDLAGGAQPSAAAIQDAGFFMETFALFGNGKFGLAEFDRISRIPGFFAPFQAEMLTLYVIREFTLDLIDHLAKAEGGAQAATLAAGHRRALGIGNVTDAGMAPFLVRHPVLVHHWVVARERALARVRAAKVASERQANAFMRILARAVQYAASWGPDRIASAQQLTLSRELASFQAALSADKDWWRRDTPWARLMDQAEGAGSIDFQEMINSLVLEPQRALVDPLFENLCADENFRIDPLMPLSALLDLIDRFYGWALSIDFSDPQSEGKAWRARDGFLGFTVSERRDAPLRPFDAEPVDARLGVARDVVRLRTALRNESRDALLNDRVGAFLRRRPECRAAVKRVQICAKYPYGELRENVLQGDMAPSDLLRFTLAFLGADHIRAENEDVVLSSLYQGAPTASEIAAVDPDAWAFSAGVTAAA
ncbi:MAG: hypothetical protein QNJ84_03865 [Alphaproteobacteria bacterium]|nr:hypothetical protein [Alphaproteobacteria bacterium]